MRLIVWALAAVLFGLTLFEVSMQPSWPERIELALIFVAMAAAMTTAARLLPSVARRYRSIRITVAVLALAAFSIVVLGALAVGNRMFLSGHDLTLLLVVIAFGVVSAIGFAIAVSKPLTADLEKLSDTAGLVASGDLDHGVSIDRQDEIGRLSVALDRMIHQLEAAEESRRSDTEARSEFFAAVGHDLRTPLASMRVAVESIRDGVTTDPEAHLEAIERDIGALTNLVEDIYLLARLDSGAVETPRVPVDVTEVADETIELLRPLADKAKVQLELLAIDRYVASGDATAVGRILRNLVDNAIRMSPPYGRVALAIEGERQMIRVSVIDEGPGFPEEFRSIAFERFTRYDNSRDRSSGGSGLGLAIAKGLVESMNGSIWIANGVGGELSFTLPRP